MVHYLLYYGEVIDVRVGAQTVSIGVSAWDWLKSWVSIDDLAGRIKAAIFRAASRLTDPICKSHELFRRLYVVDALHPSASKAANWARKFFLFLGLVGAAAIAIVTTAPGIALRGLASFLQKEPFIYVRGRGGEKTLPSDRTFSLLSWNICCTAGGYSISDGGVMPWSYRIEDICDKILEKDADVNCLYETFDTGSAFYLCEKLKEKGYAHFYFNIGPKAIGVSSGIFIASKYAIGNPEFTPYPQDMLVGRTKFAAKGLFAFDLQSKGSSFARVHATHLQHSEECAYPTDEEKTARQRQMGIIVSKAKGVRNKCVVITGDLNLNDEEYRSSFWQARFEKGDRFADPDKTQGMTWGGDEFCARMVGKRHSPAMNLDHTAVMGGTARAIRTDLVKTGFDAARFTREGLSDHAGLFSEISI